MQLSQKKLKIQTDSCDQLWFMWKLEVASHYENQTDDSWVKNQMGIQEFPNIGFNQCYTCGYFDF
jgi:hypothetical protein